MFWFQWHTGRAGFWVAGLSGLHDAKLSVGNQMLKVEMFVPQSARSKMYHYLEP